MAKIQEFNIEDIICKQIQLAIDEEVNRIAKKLFDEAKIELENKISELAAKVAIRTNQMVDITRDGNFIGIRIKMEGEHDEH